MKGAEGARRYLTGAGVQDRSWCINIDGFITNPPRLPVIRASWGKVVSSASAASPCLSCTFGLGECVEEMGVEDAGGECARPVNCASWLNQPIMSFSSSTPPDVPPRPPLINSPSPHVTPL